MQEIVANYKGTDGTTFCALLTDMLSYLKKLPKSFGDYLGDMYMEIEAGNKNAGQYFTPYDVSRLIAEVTISEPADKDKPITLCEPCCGSGGMALAAAEVLQNYGFNYADKLLVVANDIDRHCVLMAYTQLSFAAIPAIIKWQDILIVSQRLGHSDVTQTLNTYSHLMPNVQRQIINALDFEM